MDLGYASITKKVLMALLGLFLITFLLVHLSINLTILIDDGRETFNKGAHFMGTNPAIQIFQWVLFAGFFFHILLGITLQLQNWNARPKRYKVPGNSEDSFFSKYMIHTGAIILALLVLHLFDFFAKAKFGHMDTIMHGTREYEDMGILVINAFKELPKVIIYVAWLLFLGFHLDHAFHSALQSLGLNHSKYTPAIKVISRVLAILITVGYILIPVVVYLS